MIPEFYRKSQIHRALWATMKTLAEHDDIGLVSKLSVPRAAVTTAMDRRLTILEHETSEKLKAYFQMERHRIVGAIKLYGAAGVDDVIERLRPELRSVLLSIYQSAGQDWGRWALRSMPESKKKAKDDEPTRRPIAGPIGVGDLEVPIDTWLAENIGKKIVDISESSRKMIASQIRSGMKLGESLGQIARRIDNFYLEDIIPNRAMTIARTETGTITNFIQHLIAQDTQNQGVSMEKEWASLRDARVRPTHREADGQRVALDEPFEVGDALLMYPLDPLGPPEEVIECRCGVMYHVVDEEKAAFVKFEKFAKSVANVESPDVAVMLGFVSGVFPESEDFVDARKRLMKRVHQIRRAGPVDEPRDEQGRWTTGGGNEGAASEPTESAHHTEHMPEAQATGVRKYEAELHGRTGKKSYKERMVILGPDGTVIIDKEGKHRSVPFNGREVNLVAAVGGTVLTHNHPDDGGYSLSPNDVAAAHNMNAAEVRAVGRDYTYSLRPKDGKKWPNPLVMNTMYEHTQRPMVTEARKRGDETLGKVSDVDRTDPKAVKAFNKEAVSFQEAENLKMQHETWMQIANKLSLRYTRIKRKP